MISENFIYFIIYSDQHNQRCSITTLDIHTVLIALHAHERCTVKTINISLVHVSCYPGISVVCSNQFPAAGYLDTR